MHLTFGWTSKTDKRFAGLAISSLIARCDEALAHSAKRSLQCGHVTIFPSPDTDPSTF